MAHRRCGARKRHATQSSKRPAQRAVLVWDPPPYRELTDQSLEFYEAIARFDAWCVVLEKDLPEVYAILGPPVAVLPRGRDRATYLVAKHASRKVVVRRHAPSEPVGPFWPAARAVVGSEGLTVTTCDPVNQKT